MPAKKARRAKPRTRAAKRTGRRGSNKRRSETPASLIDNARGNTTNRHLVIETSIPSPGQGLAVIEQYDGQEDFYVTLAGTAMSDASAGSTHIYDGVCWRFDDPTLAEAYGAALIAAGQKAREMGLVRSTNVDPD